MTVPGWIPNWSELYTYQKGCKMAARVAIGLTWFKGIMTLTESKEFGLFCLSFFFLFSEHSITIIWELESYRRASMKTIWRLMKVYSISQYVQMVSYVSGPTWWPGEECLKRKRQGYARILSVTVDNPADISKHQFYHLVFIYLFSAIDRGCRLPHYADF